MGHLQSIKLKPMKTIPKTPFLRSPFTHLDPLIPESRPLLAFKNLASRRNAPLNSARFQKLISRSLNHTLIDSSSYSTILEPIELIFVTPSTRILNLLYHDTMFFNEAERWAMTLSTFAGLSTTIGGLLAIIKRPSDALLAFLLGTAFGVMFCLSIAEMWLHNAMEHGWPNVTAAVLSGMLLYQVAQPFLPDFKYEDIATAEEQGESSEKSSASKIAKHRSAELFRLGLLMAFTMTLHNLPEGFAVAFASFTDFGPVMAMAIAMHNIPEGIIVAAPVYAATGSRWKALTVATASGLSEPLGALIALLAAKPILSEEGLHHILAFVGGIMAAVCMLELWPEGKKCRSDSQMLYGILLGGGLMGWTLYLGV